MAYPTTHPTEAADQTVLDLAGARCPRLSAPGEVARRLALLDEQYIRANFVSLDDLAADQPQGAHQVRNEIGRSRLPQPAYRLDDTSDMVPVDYFEPVVLAGSVAALPDWFTAEYRAAARRCELPCDAASVDSEWRAYLSGGYFVCLKHATPAMIVEKARLVTNLDNLIANPLPADPGWRTLLRTAVNQLAAIERPFAILDPARWGTPMSGQWYGTFLRALFPAAFEVPQHDTTEVHEPT